ncbi:vacuolar protein sorting 41 [Ephemerocybe angulata]|uniref:Vacuolar protein sorting-associated protein 41 n=1 Tax=Ephemerocybe angulata TaxID=980116 RepID=A0A8H6HKZ1_9AGAR|nr:vacuolar protein sorting 41 [Tulosesus angulatus]
MTSPTGAEPLAEEREPTEAEKGRFTDSPGGMDEHADDIEDDDGNEEDGSRDDDGSEKDSEDGESSDDSESDDEEDDEPVLKYSRIEGSVPEILKKDSASAIAVSGNRLVALGTHAGIVHVLDLTGKRLKSYKPHLASIVDIEFDETGDFIATASIDGQIYVRSLSTPEFYTSNLKRPMRTIALEPSFASRSTRAFVAGGLAGSLIMYDKGWLGHRETVIAQGEGPIWQVRWVGGRTTGSGGFIAWASDAGVKVWHVGTKAVVAIIDRPAGSPRSELFKPTLMWQDESTLLIAWADYLTVARLRARAGAATNGAAQMPPYTLEVTSVFQMDACVVAGIVPHPLPPEPTASFPEHEDDGKSSHSTHTNGTVATQDSKRPVPPIPHRRHSVQIPSAPPLTTFLLLTYIPPPSLLTAADEAEQPTDDSVSFKRRAAEPPELRIVSRTTGEDIANDVLRVREYEKWGCNEYSMALVPGEGDRLYVVMSPRDLIIVRKMDKRDRVRWLVERGRWEEALKEVEDLEPEEGDDLTVEAIGQKYLNHLLDEEAYDKAAALLPKVCGRGKTKAVAQRWEEQLWAFAGRGQLQAVIPYVPTDAPRLDHVVYEMVLGHFLGRDLGMLLQTVKSWPREIYDVAAVIVAVKAKLEKLEKGGKVEKQEGGNVLSRQEEVVLLMECLSELYTANRQPGKALPYYLRLRKPNVFELIRDNNLFTDVQDQVLLLVEFDHELMERRKKEQKEGSKQVSSEAIKLLVDNIHSIPINRVVQQLQKRPDYLFLYLDALVEKDPHLVSEFADLQVKMYAEFATNYYNLEQAFQVCKERDLVPEMVFLLGRMGNNKAALTLIIERLGDVHRAIEFAKSQNDDDLWEDLLRYSETRPAFIRGLLENVGVEISPVRLIRRIRNGLEIPGLKDALVKILLDFQLQIELLEGCKNVLEGDCVQLVEGLGRRQSGGFWLSATSKCPVCSEPLHQQTSACGASSLTLLFLCRHVVHASCASGGNHLPLPTDPMMRGIGYGAEPGRKISSTIAFESMIRPRLRQGCPVCHAKDANVAGAGDYSAEQATSPHPSRPVGFLGRAR